MNAHAKKVLLTSVVLLAVGGGVVYLADRVWMTKQADDFALGEWNRYLDTCYPELNIVSPLSPSSSGVIDDEVMKRYQQKVKELGDIGAIRQRKISEYRRWYLETGGGVPAQSRSIVCDYGQKKGQYP